jgi:hypothetical protein
MLKGMAMEAIPCSICSESDHKVGRCPELWQNKTPPPEKGGDHDEDSLVIVRTSGNFKAHDFIQTRGSRAGQWKPLSVIKI